jgi:hypothetical protein
MLIIIIILIIFLVYLLRNNISLQSLLNTNFNENFLIAVKDRQKIGTTDNEDGRQPKSTWKSGGMNYETCYSTETRNGNTTGRKGTYFCKQGGDSGEAIPGQGMYALDMSNYTIHPGRAIRGKPLKGNHSNAQGKAYTLNNDGVVTSETLTLAQSKALCDALKDKCAGFVMIIPVEGAYRGKTIFISSIDEGWEDPDNYAKKVKLSEIATNTISYVKKDVNYVEKAVPENKINTIADKYLNLSTCNWKSANRCIFRDYKYEQSNGTCRTNDGLSYNVDALKDYNEQALTDWLKALYNRDMGVNKLASEAVNVNEYIQRCKDVDGYEFLGTVDAPNPYNPPRQGDVRGRYVRITINNKDVNDNWLQLAEVQVISNNRNVALNKSASSSGNWPGSANSKANDGNNDGNWAHGSVYHSAPASGPHWPGDGNPAYWEVDLGDASITIDRVIVSNRTDGWNHRLNNWLLSIHDNNRSIVWARIYKDPPNSKVSIDISQANNDRNNPRVKDFSSTQFNRYFYNVSDTGYKSKLGRQSGCDEECHKNVCEGEKKKWLGDYQCRDYRAGEYEAEQIAKANASIQEDAFTVIYRGIAYRVLGNTHPINDNNLRSGSPNQRIPDGWRIAPDNADSKHVMQMGRWGVNGLITDSGHAYYTRITPNGYPNDEPIFGRNAHSMLTKTGDTYSPNCGPCAVLISRPASLNEDEYTVFYNGKLYKCLAGWKKNDPRIQCQTWFIDIPAGWRVADNNADSRHVIMTNAWGTHSMVVNDKRVYGTPSWNTGNFVDGWKHLIDLDATKGRIRYCMGSFLLVKI